jgi:hypothetical protein
MRRRIPAIVIMLCVAFSAFPGCGKKDKALFDPAWPKRAEYFVPVQKLTHGPAYHWFGYYDKLQMDETGRYVLGMEVGFQDRSPGPDDVITVGMVDLQDRNRWIALGESRAWNWQQGCMLQWIPGRKDEIIWNDRQGDAFVAHIMNVRTRAKRTIPSSIYALSPDGKTAVTADFRRIQHMRPGYGYAGIGDPNREVLAPDTSGIWRVDLASGQAKLIVTIRDMLKIPYRGGRIDDKKHWFNHLLFNTDGTRFSFLNRWHIREFRASNPTNPFDTRLLTAKLDGSDIRVMDDYGYTSHYIWRDPEHILAWARHPSRGDRFYLYRDDGSVNPEAVGPDVMTRNGHCTYLPGNEWILNDTYPDEERLQHVYVYHLKTNRRFTLAKVFLSPDYKFDSETRVDTHPRYSRDGSFAVIDSPHDGDGRQLYLLDLRPVYKITHGAE